MVYKEEKQPIIIEVTNDVITHKDNGLYRIHFFTYLL